MNLFTHDATYYAHQIKKKHITSVELTKRAIANIKKLNPHLNAITHLQEQEALKQAHSLDDALAQLKDTSSLPPFYGVPTLLKDVGQNQIGHPSTSGAALLKHHIARHTDRFVADVLAAGFVIVGRTNVPEFAFKGVSDSSFTGSVNHPIDLNRNPGGSSGGAAAALKAGIVPITMGSDGGGSIRLPASFCGLIGFKPSRGRIGVGPFNYRSWQGASVNFALTRSVRDTWQLLHHLQTEQLEAPFMLPKIPTDVLVAPSTPLTIAYSYDSPIGAPTSDISHQNLSHTIDILRSLGHHLVEASPDTDDIAILKSYYQMNSIETAAMFHSMEASMGRRLTVNDMEPMTWLMFKAGESISATTLSQLLSDWDQYTAKREAFISQYDLALTPITDGPAPLHHQFELDQYAHEMIQSESLSANQQQQLIWRNFEKGQNYMAYALYQNIAGQPAISLPLFETVNGLPIGSHFWAAKGADYSLLQLALQLEHHGYLKTTIHTSSHQ